MAVWPAIAQDDLALLTRAITDYERIALAGKPDLKDAIACEQSQATLLPVMRPDQQYLAYFRKGICELVAGRLRNNESEIRSAVGDLQQAITRWPALSPAGGETVTGALRVALIVARLHAAGPNPDLEGAGRDLAAVIARPNCPGTLLMPASECDRYVDLGRLWLGWVRYRQGRLDEAARLLNAFPKSSWGHRVTGLLAFERRDYWGAAAALERAVAVPEPAGLTGLLGPAADTAGMQYELAVARVYTNRPAEALPVLDAAIKGNPMNAQALFLRGRARELLGQDKQAQADFELASRTAFANVNVPFESGYAHFYRGVALYRRKDFRRAESEFASALNFEIADSARPDVGAWRNMAAVAAGSCEGSAAGLRGTLPQTSPLFPKAEAERLLLECHGVSAVTQNRP
jgi:tetratricopeptide (TPR) repeat protein